MADRVLICDDEKNIRLTVTAALESEGYVIETAVNGEDALRQLETRSCTLLLLDLKMPGIDGLEVLRRLANFPDPPRVVILTAHGTVGAAVEAMKLGAVDFVQKPFSPDEIRQVVAQAVNLGPGKGESESGGYESHIAQAIQLIKANRRQEALEASRRALYANPQRPEAYNLFGVLNELKGDIPLAQRFYRSALDIDPSFDAAQLNLERASSLTGRGKIELGEITLNPQPQK
jgi:DNA-binding response OmpR family regulator